MNSTEAEVQQTQHAFLVTWGHFATQIDLVQGIQYQPNLSRCGFWAHG